MTEEFSKKEKNILNKEKKILCKIIVAYIVAILIFAIIKDSKVPVKTIEQKIGSMAPYSLNLKDALTIKTISVDQYIKYIKEGKMEKAYKMLSKEYRNFKTFEEFLKEIEGIDFDTFLVNELKIKSDGTYIAYVQYNRNEKIEQKRYIIYGDSNNEYNMKISLDDFVINYEDLNFETDNIGVIIKSCDIYLNNIKMNLVLKNNSDNKDFKLEYIGLGYNDAALKEKKVDNILKPKEQKEIQLDFETQYFIPNNLKIKRIMGDKLRTYTLFFKDAEITDDKT